MQVEIRDGAVIKTEPKGIMTYVAMPFSKWMARLPHA
jgi:hypothetical protein